jgi:hypothetical protein
MNSHAAIALDRVTKIYDEPVVSGRIVVDLRTPQLLRTRAQWV